VGDVISAVVLGLFGRASSVPQCFSKRTFKYIQRYYLYFAVVPNFCSSPTAHLYMQAYR